MSLPRMSLHIGDYRKNTGHLSAAEHGAYLLLIMHYFATEKPPPDNDKQLARIACMSPAEWKKSRPVIAALFKEGWRHTRVEEELVQAKERYEKRASAGRRGAEAKRKQCSSNTNAMLQQEALLEQPLTLTLTKVEEEGGGCAREPVPKSLVSAEGNQLADECLRSIGMDEPPLKLAGLRYQAEVWVSDGWNPAAAVAAFSRIVKTYPDKPFGYIVKAMRTALAASRAPPPTSVVTEISPYLAVNRSTGRGRQSQAASPLIEAADRLVERSRAELARARGEAELFDGACQTPPRSVPAW